MSCPCVPSWYFSHACQAHLALWPLLLLFALLKILFLLLFNVAWCLMMEGFLDLHLKYPHPRLSSTAPCFHLPSPYHAQQLSCWSIITLSWRLVSPSWVMSAPHRWPHSGVLLTLLTYSFPVVFPSSTSHFIISWSKLSWLPLYFCCPFPPLKAGALSGIYTAVLPDPGAVPGQRKHSSLLVEWINAHRNATTHPTLKPSQICDCLHLGNFHYISFYLSITPARQ